MCGVYVSTRMSTKRTVKLEPDVYDRVAAQKRDDETFSEAIERLIGSRGVSLLDLCDEDAEYDEERHRERLETLERTAEADQRESEERQERYDS